MLILPERTAPLLMLTTIPTFIAAGCVRRFTATGGLYRWDAPRGR